MMRPEGPGEELSRAAARLIGSPFKLHGRNPQTGLDCVGLIAASLEAIGRKPFLPVGYALRSSNIDRWQSCFARSGFELVEGEYRAGDTLVARPSPIQHHLMIVEMYGTVVHAHAGLRRVVRQPLSDDIELAAHWRLSHPE